MFNQGRPMTNFRKSGTHIPIPLPCGPQIQSNRTFNMSAINMGNSTPEKMRNPAHEVSAKVINRDNGYPNNMPKAVDQVDFCKPSCMGPAGSSENKAEGGPPVTLLEEVEVIDIIGFVSLCKQARSSLTRTVSECQSEDSFIVFEGGCGTQDTDDDFYDAATDTDESEDEDSDTSSEEDDEDANEEKTHKTEAKKMRNFVHTKKVHFPADNKLAVVHTMITWSFAYRASRKGHWEEFVRDRDRFKRRIESCRCMLEKVLNADHRQLVFTERFEQLLNNTEKDITNTGSHSDLIAEKPQSSRKPRRNRNRRNGKKKKKRNRHKRRR